MSRAAATAAVGPGPYRLPSAFRGAGGGPRFHLTIPQGLLQDPGIRLLVLHETERSGYEYPARRFLDEHLRPGDVFIDVGAHLGMFALQSATLPAGRIDVLAIEAHPTNVIQLLRAVNENRLTERIEVIAAAAGGEDGTAPLVFNSTMGHSLHGFGLPDGAPRLGGVTVAVLTIDRILATRPALHGRRVFLKIDVEGFEPEVVAGAGRLLASGRLAAVIWEYGMAFRRGERRAAMEAMCARLAAGGFRMYRFPHPTMGGPLLPFVATPECCNVFALAPGVEPCAIYDMPVRRPEPLPPLERASAEFDTQVATTRLLIAHQATDGARWADFEAQRDGAAARAEQVKPWIPAGASVLDLGAGVMALRSLLPAGCTYVPADLLPFDPATVVIDFNQMQFPAGSFDVVVALDVLEFVHNPEDFLRRAAAVSPHLIVSYRPAGATSEDTRRACGFFTDLGDADVVTMLERCGWRISESREAAERRFYDCLRA